MGNDRRKSQSNYRKGISFQNKTQFHQQPKKEFRTKQKEGYVLFKGTVIESYPNARFLVELDDIGNQINATLAGKLRQNYIKILTGDRVEIELSVYDTTQGRISRRI